MSILIVALVVAALAPAAEPAVESFPNIYHWRDCWTEGGPRPLPHAWSDYRAGGLPAWRRHPNPPTYALDVIVAYDVGNGRPRTIKERCTGAVVCGEVHWRSARIHAVGRSTRFFTLEKNDMAWNHHLEESRGWIWPQQIIAWRPVSAPASQGELS
ncbi:MAG: hypothetical protein EKK55_22660 [Rhodocyclaceae bacterium]|nr:MAG: hypothetical protein EKK55_22660 [Rhodocyclaceae bacterium]